MELLNSFAENLKDLVPTVVAVVTVVVGIWLVRLIMLRQVVAQPGKRYRVQLVTLLLSLVGLVIIILALPVNEATAGQLLSLLGILLSAAIALSATTFVGNVMAGFMLRAVRNFRPGDFIRVGDNFGRVSERGLFHIEIQTEDRDLTTLPNLYLVTNPVKVVRSSGTLTTAEVSLGYNLPHGKVEELLTAAAADAGLEEPFVHITALGDYSVTYRVAGLLTDVRSLLSTRSRLHARMLDRLHEAGVEIVSPTFMNQRVLPLERKFIPEPGGPPTEPRTVEAEKIVFDKAEEAASLESLRAKRESMAGALQQLKDQLGKADDDDRAEMEDTIAAAELRLKHLDEYIKLRQERDRTE